MSPSEDARLLLAIVRRHLRGLRVGLDPAFPEEDWGFSAQQAVEKLLKVHDLADLADLAGQPLDPVPRQLQVFAVEARYEEGPFPLPAERRQLLALLEAEPRRCEDAVAEADRTPLCQD